MNMSTEKKKARLASSRRAKRFGALAAGGSTACRPPAPVAALYWRPAGLVRSETIHFDVRSTPNSEHSADSRQGSRSIGGGRQASAAAFAAAKHLPPVKIRIRIRIKIKIKSFASSRLGAASPQVATRSDSGVSAPKSRSPGAPLELCALLAA